ncbi:hypothetical protein PR048_002346 [Dryococelus australis]|uniref:Uncharacterized protein n=1 Tax=Dryococelus australis TaxID=614101 RepID=A0ABQ9IJY9_9NEOP|nr:hypothetical protein PR048_002346 [Dryococelus australis]
MRVGLEGLPQLMHEHDEVQKQLELYDEHSEQHEHDRESFENTYYEVLGWSTAITIKLPALTGNITEFRHFQGTFTSLVINNDSLDNIQEHQHLL